MGYGEFVTGGEDAMWALNASAGSWVLLAVTALESVLVQYWVVRRRARQWNEPIQLRNLVWACLVAKGLVAIPWVLFLRHVWLL